MPFVIFYEVSRIRNARRRPEAEKTLENLLNECRRCKAKAETLRQADKEVLKDINAVFEDGKRTERLQRVI